MHGDSTTWSTCDAWKCGNGYFALDFGQSWTGMATIQILHCGFGQMMACWIPHKHLRLLQCLRTISIMARVFYSSRNAGPDLCCYCQPCKSILGYKMEISRKIIYCLWSPLSLRTFWGATCPIWSKLNFGSEFTTRSESSHRIALLIYLVQIQYISIL